VFAGCGDPLSVAFCFLIPETNGLGFDEVSRSMSERDDGADVFSFRWTISFRKIHPAARFKRKFSGGETRRLGLRLKM
jgi:hypothetical protein